MMLPPINFKKWIEENRHLLKPPVGNKLIWEDSEFIIMVVGGPNSRKDYHIDASEEFFYQLEGDINLKLIDKDGGTPRDFPIKEGEIFLLPANVPHSPRRPAGTLGLVIERKRSPEELDGFQWYCEKCGKLLYQAKVPVKDIVKELPPLFDRFFGDASLCTCKHCGEKMNRS